MTRPADRPVTSRATLEYEPILVEEAVRYALENGAADLPEALRMRLRYKNRRRLDTLYELPQGEKREAAFRSHFQELFQAAGLDRFPAEWLETFGALAADLERVLVLMARSPADEGAELWESREFRGHGIPSYLVISVRPPALGHPEELRNRVLPSLRLAAERLALPVEVEGQAPEAAVVNALETHCPLCRFPTTDWAAPELVSAIAQTIEADFPEWGLDASCCSHCAERYQELATPSMAASPY